MPATEAFAGTTDEMWAAHREFLNAGGQLELELGGFLVRTADRLVLVDTGVGRSIPPFEGGHLLESLAAWDVSPQEVTDVLFTHLHFDHVGWATRQGDVVFPTRKLSPLSGQLATWDTSGPIIPGIDALAAPGHTPGSTVIVISSGAERALLLGDVVHCPVQLVDDEWAIMGDVDPDLARQTRNQLAAELEGSGTLATGAHFTGMRFGRLLPASGRRYWSSVGI